MCIAKSYIENFVVWFEVGTKRVIDRFLASRWFGKRDRCSIYFGFFTGFLLLFVKGTDKQPL